MKAMVPTSQAGEGQTDPHLYGCIYKYYCWAVVPSPGETGWEGKGALGSTRGLMSGDPLGERAAQDQGNDLP